METRIETKGIIPQVRAGDPISASGWNAIAGMLNRPYDTMPKSGNAMNLAVATIEDVLEARSGTTPGGPVDATIRLSTEGDAFAAGTVVDLYSWVKTDSADPADQAGGILYVFIAKAIDGSWWFIGQDCTLAPLFVAVDESTFSSPPTDAQLDTAFGTPVTLGPGFMACINSGGSGTNFYQVISDGTNWWIFAGTKAT